MRVGVCVCWIEFLWDSGIDILDLCQRLIYCLCFGSIKCTNRMNKEILDIFDIIFFLTKVVKTKKKQRRYISHNFGFGQNADTIIQSIERLCHRECETLGRQSRHEISRWRRRRWFKLYLNGAITSNNNNKKKKID